MIVIADLYGRGDLHNEKARQEYREIKTGVFIQRYEGERTFAEMFRRYYKRVLIAMSAQALAQLNGINVISYYAPLVFESAGWIGRQAIFMTGINGLTYLASTIPPWYVVDRWGRRPILLWGAMFMIIALSLMAFFILIDISSTRVMTVVLVMVYNAAFGASWGPVPWLYPPEILPLSIRAKGASLSTASNWAFNFLVGEITPVLQAAIKWRLYLIHAFFCACSFVLGKPRIAFLVFYFYFLFMNDLTNADSVYFLYPETSGVRLEDMDLLFGDAIPPYSNSAAPTENSPLIARESSIPSLGIQYMQDNNTIDESSIPGLDIHGPCSNGNNHKWTRARSAENVD